jgi:hypothetical protein
MPYRRPYYLRGRRQKSPQTSSQETADQALREIYRQARREISEQSQNLRINLFGLLFSGIVSVVPSVAIVGVLFWYLFSFAFPLPPRHVSPYYETGHAVVVLVILVSAIYFPGTVLNYYLWPKILKIAGFIVVAVAFYFGLKARTNHLYIVFPVILYPPSQDGIEHPRQVFQGFVAPQR